MGGKQPNKSGYIESSTSTDQESKSSLLYLAIKPERQETQFAKIVHEPSSIKLNQEIFDHSYCKQEQEPEIPGSLSINPVAIVRNSERLQKRRSRTAPSSDLNSTHPYWKQRSIPRIVLKKIKIGESEVEDFGKSKTIKIEGEQFLGFEPFECNPILTPTTAKFGHLVNLSPQTGRHHFGNVKVDPSTAQLIEGRESPVVVLNRLTVIELKKIESKSSKRSVKYQWGKMGRKSTKLVLNPVAAASAKKRKSTNLNETVSDENKKKRKRKNQTKKRKIKLPTIPDNFLNINHKVKEFIYDFNTAVDKVLTKDEQLTFQGRVIGERLVQQGKKQVLVKWFPPDVIENEWMEEEAKLEKIVSIKDLSFAQKQELGGMFGVSSAKKRPRKLGGTKVPETRRSFHKEASLDSGILENFEHSSTASPANSETTNSESNSSFESALIDSNSNMIEVQKNWKDTLSKSKVERTGEQVSVGNKRGRKRKNQSLGEDSPAAIKRSKIEQIATVVR